MSTDHHTFVKTIHCYYSMYSKFYNKQHMPPEVSLHNQHHEIK